MLKVRLTEVANGLRKVEDLDCRLMAEVLIATKCDKPLVRRVAATLKVATLEKGIEILGTEMCLNYLKSIAVGDPSAVWIYRNCK